ncbi:hypothetical protein [Lysobacter sp. yr284]|uniref:hypothetical protein n=1 Tax=Lysobacter sp. yr284 TaxID=1761791 RepID=UPI001113AF69|nr:hypothetical protein [Lysobacter sp. yr284]
MVDNVVTRRQFPDPNGTPIGSPPRQQGGNTRQRGDVAVATQGNRFRARPAYRTGPAASGGGAPQRRNTHDGATTPIDEEARASHAIGRFDDLPSTRAGIAVGRARPAKS